MCKFTYLYVCVFMAIYVCICVCSYVSMFVIMFIEYGFKFQHNNKEINFYLNTKKKKVQFKVEKTDLRVW